MRNWISRWIVTGFVLCFLLASANVQASQPREADRNDEAAIRAALNSQVENWNRGDINAFMSGYEDSTETTFIGTAAINKGFQPILERYKKGYTNREQMGTLTFKDLEVRMLGATTGATEYAIVTGRFHLERTAKGSAAKDDGIFSLIWHKNDGKWRIILDHTC